MIRLANQKVKLLQTLQRHGIVITRKFNSEWSENIVCPFPRHKGGNERTGSFGYNYLKDNFFCFGCQKSGGTVEFIAFKENLEKLAVAQSILDEFSDYSKEIEVVENLNPQIEKNIFEFAQYMNLLMARYKYDEHIMKQLDKISVAFDNFVAERVYKNKLELPALEAMISKLKEYLGKYE